MRPISFVVAAEMALLSSFAWTAVPETDDLFRAPPQHDARRIACADQEALFRSRIAFMEAKLDLSPSQRSTWDAFVTQARAAETPLRSMCASPPPLLGEDIIASLERRQARFDALLQSRRDFLAALKLLAVSLKPEQRQILLETIRHLPRPPFRPPGAVDL